jgi:anaerobic ribonucleoside-triphosphate reductase
LSSTIAKIIKRDKSVADFYPDKITTAIRKAFIEVRKTVDEAILHQLTATILSELEQRFVETTPQVEHVQDLVEKHLMQWHLKWLIK